MVQQKSEVLSTSDFFLLEPEEGKEREERPTPPKGEGTVAHCIIVRLQKFRIVVVP